MHVRHVVRQYPPMVGGLEEAVASLAHHLATEQGIETSVVTLDRSFADLGRTLPAEDTIRGIPIRRIPFRGSRRYPIAPSVLRHLDGADLVHVHAIDFFFDFLALTRPLHRKPLVASTHGGFFHSDFGSRAKRVYFQSITRASAAGYRRIIASSENDAATFGAIAPRHTIAIENGVDTRKWHDAASATPERTMIAIGRFSSNKNLPALIALIRALNAGGAQWRLIIAGLEWDQTAADLAAVAGQQGVASAVTIVAGPDNRALAGLIGQASYIASASRYEGFGLGAVEGLSAGLTPILNRIAPFERLVGATGRGIVLDLDDAATAAAQIERRHGALAADHTAERMRNIAAAAVYAWPGVAARFAAEYRRVLDRKPHRADA